jgi:peptidyl-prolyl cis-trans isomerase D
MQFFRKLIKSKVGGYVALGFLVLMFFGFAAGDITNISGLNMLGGPNAAEAAKIGNQTLTVAQLQERTQRVFERVRQDRPEMTIAQFLAEGGLRQVADEMIAIKAMIAYGDKHGMRVSKKLVDAEIAGNAAFADATGAFSQAQFDAMLAQQRVAEKDLREDLAGQIIQQHILATAGAGVRAPARFVPPYAAMLVEQRIGEAIAVPSVDFAPKAAPSEAVLKAFYAANPDEFMLPEQRKIRYVLIDRARFDAQAAPTQADFAQAYKARAAQYAARTVRSFTQLILPTEAQAKAIAAKAASGRPLAELAREIGLSTTAHADFNTAQLAAHTGAEIAKAGFAAAQGALVGPMRSPLGWTLLRVENVRTIAGTSLEQAKVALAPELKLEKGRQLLADFINRLDGRLGNGETLAEIAQAEALTIAETPLVTAEGRSLRDPAFQPDATTIALLKAGFAMGAEDDPQIVAVKPEEIAALLVPGDIVAAGPPPFAQARAAAEIAWRLSEGAKQASRVANQLNAALNKGVPVDAAIAQAGLAKPLRQPLAVRRIELSQQGAKVPPPITALLALRPGSARVVAVDKSQGFLVVRLEKIVADDPTANPSLMQSARAGISNVLGSEYARALVTAIEQELKVARNPAAFAAVEAALRTANGAAQ